MSAIEFLDSNILAYAYDKRYPEKRRTAQQLLKRAMAGQAMVSSQVMSEFAAVLLDKFSPPVESDLLLTILDLLSPIQTIATDHEMVRRAVEAHARYGVHFYDGMIIAAAERGECERILSEDLASNQKYFGITVVNPFV